MFNGLNHITPSFDCFVVVVVVVAADDDDGIYILFDNQRIKTSFFLSLLFFVEDELFSLISERKIKMNFYFIFVFKKLKCHSFALDQTLHELYHFRHFYKYWK